MDTHPHFKTRIDPAGPTRSIADELLLSATALLVLVSGVGAATVAASVIGSSGTIAAVTGLVAGVGVPATMLLAGTKLNAAIGERAIRRIGERERTDEPTAKDRTGVRDEQAEPVAHTTVESADEAETTVLTFAENDEVDRKTPAERVHVVDGTRESDRSQAEC